MYKVIQNLDQNKFTALVNEALENGWKLHGGVSVSNWYYPENYTPCTNFAQALVKD